MEVALDGADADLARGPDALPGQQGLEDLGPHVHGPGGHQDLRHKDFVVLELLADSAHAVQKSLVQDLLDGETLVHGLLDQLLDGLGLALL